MSNCIQKPELITPDFEHIPGELKSHTQWILWKLEYQKDRWTKVPYAVSTGKRASVTNPTTWTTFAEAEDAYSRGEWDGVGFVLTSEDPFTCIDLDHCPEAPWALGIINHVNSYTEVSPSGDGYHIWMVATKPAGMRCKTSKFHEGAVEVYDTDRWMTMTGKPRDHASGRVEARQPVLERVCAPLLKKPAQTASAVPVRPPAHTTVDSNVLLSELKRIKPPAHRLFTGEDTGLDDASASDQSLMNALAWLTGSDPERMDLLFRQSARMRSKWDEQRGELTYGQRTIHTAIQGCTGAYDPDRRINGQAPVHSGGGLTSEECSRMEAKRRQNHQTMAADTTTPFEQVMAAIKDEDPGKVFERPILDLMTAIRRDSPPDWQRIRKAVKDAKGIALTDLLAELEKRERTQAKADSGEIFPVIEPWPEPVEGAALVRELSDTLRRYVVCEPYVADAAALWIVFTWFIDQVYVAPIANITAPLPNCGKSILLDFMGEFSFHPLKCDGISPAALFRSMDMWGPTLLIDETDAFLKENEEARGVLNSGHKRNGFIIRVEGEGADRKPVRFSTWGAKALCGIGAIADTLASRSIRLELRRKLPTEKIENLRHMPSELRDRLLRQLARLHEDLAGEVAEARPEPVRGLNNRAADNWEPLQQIAEVIGGEWPERVQNVAVTIAQNDDEELSSDINVELLKDVKSVFEGKGVESIFSAALTEALCADGDAPWGTCDKGKPMRQRQLASRLKGFGIRPQQIRIGEGTKKGYYRRQFQEVFKRYLSPAPLSGSETTKQSSNHAGYSDVGNETQGGNVSFENSREPSNHAVCFDVSDETPPSPGEKEQF
ncbi:hypothetical protein HCU01_01300 [Halomonas cupida]|uniref:Uncharacterized protein n=1 Tax=Halomonas cupida TaxID=44933 RepID=A0A1M7B126_9GAMM|nr:DUF3631 domain-containing protein [Halomonas cupida]GEN22181.1 hypothetical protein HCU01_01300 [Halomonas cupida]SHL48690.1 Protein of unknown function [Halomonas cupida]